jgi:hypothetical protein
MIAALAVALVGSPPAQADGKSWKHHGAKSGQWHKHHGHKGERHRPKADSSGVSVRGGKTVLRVDPGTGKALASLGIKVETIRPAYSYRGKFAFPITGGEVDAKTLAGQIRHSGGLAFVRGSTRVPLTDFFINVDGDPDLTAMVGDARVSILSLDLSGLERRDRYGKVELSGIKASLTAGAAAALNGAFRTDAFEPGLVIGTAKVEAYVGKAAGKPCYDDDDDDDDRHRGHDDDDDDDDDRDDD